MKFSTLSFLALAGSVGAFAPSFGVTRPSTSLDARKPFISGNWKLNPQTKEEALALASEIAGSIGDDTPDSEIALFVPYVFIESAMGAVDGKINIGAEVSSEACLLCGYQKSADDIFNVGSLSRDQWSFHRCRVCIHAPIHRCSMGTCWSLRTPSNFW
jgi:hypothetical protein